MSARARLALALLWLGVLAGLTAVAAAGLRVGGDLRLFMPSAQTEEQRLLLEQLGEGPASRLLLVALGDAPPERLAQLSQGLVAALADSEAFVFVGNGEHSADAIDDTLLPYRYLLSPTLDSGRLDAPTLRQALRTRLRDLASPAAALVEPWVARDPTLETVRLAEAWTPAAEPGRRYGVWFDRAGEQALLLAHTHAAGFDPQGQQVALDALRAAFAAQDPGAATLTVSGPGAFSVRLRGDTQREAAWLGAGATLALVLLLALAYRRPSAPMLAVLPLASAVLAGLAAVAAGFGEVHGITVAFGCTLVGVAQDYPVHLFSHQRAGVSPWHSVRAIWPTLATGVVSTCIAYLAFLGSGVTGLMQLAVFTVTGLAVAALATRALLPALIDPAPRDVSAQPWVGRLARLLDRARLPYWPFALLAVLATGFVLSSSRPFWENNLGALTPVPAELVERDTQLRAELGAPDVRHLLVIEADTVQAVLERQEALIPRLDAHIARDQLADYDLAARYLPSAARQRARQAALPGREALAQALQEAGAGLPFRSGVFAPFLEEVEAARTLAPLTPQTLAGTPLQARIDSLLLTGGPRPAGLVTLTGVADAAVLRALAAAAGDDVHALDLKAASESLVADYRGRVLWALALAALALAATVRIALRSTPRALRVLAPVALSTVLVVALLHGGGAALNLFHLVALILGAGLGLDYALFFEHAGHDRSTALRTLHAVVVCSASTLIVFCLLAASSIPVLHAIGTTVALAVVLNFVLAALIARRSLAA
ncbi:MAG TPA: MMPL family transporter [Xanthomonadaceae bacterium]|nr:MMPL family transporter [Xanthomonadaceae bacterium]